MRLLAAPLMLVAARARELLLEFADFTRYSFRRHGEFTTLAEELRLLAEAARHAAEEQNLILAELRETVRRYEGLLPLGEVRER